MVLKQNFRNVSVSTDNRYTNEPKITQTYSEKRARGGEKRQPIPSGSAGTAPLPAALFVPQTSFMFSLLLCDKKLSGSAVDLSVEVCALGRRPREGVA